MARDSATRLRDADYAVASAVGITLNMYLLRHMVRLYSAFDGDLLEAIVLGEVAHHNVAGIRAQAPSALELAALLLHRGRPADDDLLPTNAYSISLATGIPRQTVRRKVASLVKKGWLKQDAKANLRFTRRPVEDFVAFNEESVRELLETARAITFLREQMAPPPGDTRQPGGRARSGAGRRERS